MYGSASRTKDCGRSVPRNCAGSVGSTGVSGTEPLMLQAQNIHAGYGRSEVLHRVSIDRREAEVVTLLGLNGARKSTLLRTISGMRPLSAGSLTFTGIDLKGRRPDQIVKLGLVQVPE